MSTDLDTTPQPQWYYARDGQRAGPIGQGVLCQWLASGQIPAATLVWHEAGQAWVEARALPVFVAAIEQRTAAAVPPPPPPAPPAAQPATTITSEPTRIEDAAAKPAGRKLLRWAVPAAACAAVAAVFAFKSTSAPQAATAQPAAVVAVAPVAAAPAKKPAEPPTLRIKISAVPTQPPAKPVTPPPATRAAVAAKPLVTPPSMDDLAQRRAAIGRWVLVGKPSGADQRRPRTTLTLGGDGRFEQAVDFCDADGRALAGGAWSCRGTWTVRNGQLVQDVAQTSNANYPAGRWAFAVQAAPAALRLDRVAAPAAYAYAGRKASYAFARAAVAVAPARTSAAR